MTEATIEPIPTKMLEISTSGLWRATCDPRGVLTMGHPYEPSAAGGQARVRCVLPPASAGRRFLRFYLSDGYAGHESGNPELNYPPEWFPKARFTTVSVGGVEIMRADVLGENPPVDERFHQLEIPGNAAGELVLAVEDVRTVEVNFATDVYWAMLAVVTVPEGQEAPTFDRRAASRPALRPSAATAGAEAGPLPTLTVRNPTDLARVEMVTSGVPFPLGRLAAPDAVAVVDGAGATATTQQRTLASWPDGSVKSLLIDWPCEVPARGLAEYRLVSDARPPVVGGLSLRQENGEIVIDTGAATAVFRRSPAILEQVVLADGQTSAGLSEPLGQLLNHDGFPSRFAGILPPERLEAVECGPLRVRVLAEGAYPEVVGAAGLRYSIRFDLSRNSADIRVQHTICNVTPGTARLRALSIRLGATGLESFGLDGCDGVLGEREAWLVQHTHERFYCWRYAATSTDLAGEGAQNRGYAWASGKQTVGISLRSMWEQHPNGFRVDEAGMQVDLWTSDRIPWVLGSDAPLELAEGEAKTHDLLLAFGVREDGEELERRLAAFQEPLFGAATPEWYCASGLFGPIAATDPERFPEYEAAVAAMEPGMMGHGRGGPWEMLARHTHEDRSTYQRYGFRHFGDNPLIWGYQTKYRMWANCEYDTAHCAFAQFARSGDLRYLWRGRQAAAHNRDTDVIHASQEHPEWVGAPHGHWIDHAEKAPNLGHLWTEGLVEDYLLTGDERSLSVARGIADYCIGSMEKGWGGSGERTAGWPMIALLGVWHGSGDDRYLEAATRLRDDVVDKQDDVRGVWSYKVYEQPAYEGGTVFMVDILCRALMRHHLATGDPGSAAAIVRAAQWLRWEAVTDTPEQPRAFYKQTPLCSRPGECSPETFAYACSLTGDSAFCDLAQRAYRATARAWSGGVPTAMMRDLPRVLGALSEPLGEPGDG